MRIARLGQGLLAIASASLAIWSFAYGDFAWGAPSLLAKIPWREVWVYGSALIILAASAGLCFPRTALPSALLIGAYEAVGAAISIPQILSKPLGVDAWYPFCEALTPLVGAWILYAMLRWQARGSDMPVAGEGSVRAAQVLFGLTCVFYGWSHFVYADYTASMVPTWLPSRLALAYLTGVGHVAAGVAIIIGILPRLAATLEAIMMSLFGLLVWVPSFFAQPQPKWATPPRNEWSELVVNVVLAASAWIVALSFANRSWTFASRSRVRMSQS
jgi:uncharacterized membrane protein YphA (DoxX/SURF4 family)